jgi:hypothetical protein
MPHDSGEERAPSAKCEQRDEAMTRSALTAARLGVSKYFDLRSITAVPRDPEERRAISEVLYERLYAILSGRLSPAELALLRSGEASRTERLFSELDRVIGDEAASLGWRILLSDVVLARIQQWHDGETNGPQLLKKFFKILERSALVARGEARHPIDAPEYYADRQSAKQEIRALRNKVCSQLAQRHKLPRLREVYSILDKEIIEFPSAYPIVSLNRLSLMRYLRIKDDEHTSLTKRLIAREATPTEIVDGWFDWGFNTPSGKSRQFISRLGSQKRGKP